MLSTTLTMPKKRYRLRTTLLNNSIAHRFRSKCNTKNIFEQDHQALKTCFSRVNCKLFRAGYSNQ